MILLFSGGYDSTILALHSIQDIDMLLHIQYDHPSKEEELHAVQMIYNDIKTHIKQKLKLHIVKLPICAENMHIGTGKKGARYVPNRNAIFLCIASNIAHSNNYSNIMFGASKLDQNDYFDCTPIFIKGLSELLRIQIHAPLLHSNLQYIPDYIDEKIYNKILSKSWSCYEPENNKPCGTCNSCTQKR